ncbi:MAG: hypothetical protein COU90_00025 [Candidatus Ryanbacteria bacterium CG10_big_fil_rev_8_21_14_0_10_43_42]|uniref:Uncharacterized protein n=1 Tax=Candidatus Ryanbacteria bacterium CG10_big_fil_rev_8_21_14_0_10_43_42 TaxID=1974864 RepID=A0A2M8KYC1_9BACT|nr:MAG: hypothetical protein COU90_00025 [Candidatus Ryanbacteria bacterium CG10_big_fil_rev_8_21_14_0_10_43_42]
MNSLFLLFIIAIFLTLGVGSIAYYVIGRKRAQKGISRSLQLVLYSVLVPQDTAENPQPDHVKDSISIMEQFYAGMVSLREAHILPFLHGNPSFVLELALPVVGEETTFYVGVPRKWAHSFEKNVHALFPHAQVERTKDYNIFNEEGATAGSVLSFTKAAYLPVRTYRHLEADPLEVVTTAFSKIKKEGEGAAVQIVVRPADGHWQAEGREAARFMRKGKKPDTRNKGWQGAATKVARDIINPPGKQADEQSSGSVMEVFNESFVNLVEGKASRAGFDVNIRIVASAGTSDDALDILQGLEDAFLQFTDPQANSFGVNRLTAKPLEDLIYNFSFRAFNEKHALYMGTEELTSLYHFPVGQLSAPKVKFLKAREAPAPANLSTEGVLLGENVFRGEQSLIRMQADDRRRHFYIIGQTGTGKTNFMKSLVHQDIMAGKGVCFIDPHGEVTEELMELIPKERVEDVIYFNPGDTQRPLGLNMLEYDPQYPEQKTFVVNELFGIFQKLYGGTPESMGPMFEQYFRNATMLVIEDPSSGNTLLEIGRVLADKAFREYKLSRSKNVVVNTFWRDVAEKAGGEGALANIVPYITSKFDVFLANEVMRPIIAQERSAFNFRTIMDNNQILLVNLSKGRLGELNSSLLGLIIVGKILMASFSRVDMPQDKRNDFYLYIDEFQNVTTSSIETILSEARKYRLNLIIAHQFVGQLEDGIKRAVFGNVGSMAALRVGAEDAEFLEQQFAPVFNAHDLMNIDNYTAYVKLLINGQTSRPFNIHTFPAPKGNSTVAEAVKELSSVKYGRPRAEVEVEINRRYGITE